jgi:hypothetical protein
VHNNELNEVAAQQFHDSREINIEQYVGTTINKSHSSVVPDDTLFV